MSVWALVPAKSFARAKSRLSPILDAQARRDLARSMLEHVLSVLAECPEIAGVMVVTDGDEVADLARARGGGAAPRRHRRRRARRDLLPEREGGAGADERSPPPRGRRRAADLRADGRGRRGGSARSARRGHQ